MIVLVRYWREAIGLGLLAVIGVLWLLLQGEQRHSAKLQERVFQTQAAFDQTVSNYRKAAELARLQDAENKARVERDQERISKEITSDYQKRLAELRARYDALRLREAPRANPGSAGGAAVPSLPDATGGADDSSLEDRLLATEQALRLKALQDWIREQASVPRE